MKLAIDPDGGGFILADMMPLRWNKQPALALTHPAANRPLAGRMSAGISLLTGLRFLTLMCLLLLAGCKGRSPSLYVSPRITGRVLDAQTRQPIPAVQVQRAGENEELRSPATRRGGESLKLPPPVRSGAEGEFVLESARALTLLQQTGWYSVTVLFAHPRYERQARTYTLTDAKVSERGEPVVNTGEILLHPRTGP